MNTQTEQIVMVDRKVESLYQDNRPSPAIIRHWELVDVVDFYKSSGEPDCKPHAVDAAKLGD